MPYGRYKDMVHKTMSEVEVCIALITPYFFVTCVEIHPITIHTEPSYMAQYQTT